MRIHYLILFLLPFSILSCAPARPATPIPEPTATPTPPPGGVPKNINFSGKLVNKQNGEWPNNRLVVLYLKGEEVGRAVSKMGKSELSGEGLTDGYFNIQVANIYEIPWNRFLFPTLAGKGNTVFDGGSWLSDSRLDIWIRELEDGSQNDITVPTKNLVYTLKVFGTDVAFLPKEMLRDKSTRLTKDNRVVLVATAATTPDQKSTRTDIRLETVNYGTTDKEVPINKITVPMDNCKGSSVLSYRYAQTQTFVKKYTMDYGGQIGIEIPLGFITLLAELQSKYGFEQSQIDSQTVEYDMKVDPGWNVKYIITWSEVWRSGNAKMVTANDSVDVPFQVKTNLIYRVDSQKSNCN